MAASGGKISIGFKIEAGKDGLQNLVVDAKQLHKFMESTVSETEKLKRSFINLAAVSTALDSAANTLSQLQGIMKEYSSAWQTQSQVEQQLAQVMRNTMDAREEDIQSIKDYCSAQQKIGIIGDEVQLAGAQELATYLSLKSSLQSLIPVMNDMLAQQYGYSASAENASQIATMLGKVMEGQTGALSRYGYKFDEAQEKILKYGTESERVATLVDVVTESVGGMNEKLAQTPAGKAKQLENAMGDAKEEIGRMLEKAQPIVDMTANIMLATIGTGKLCASIITTTKALSQMIVTQKTLNAVIKATGVSARVASVALKSMLLATGVGAVIFGISTALEYFKGKADEATEAAKRFRTEEELMQEERSRAEAVAEAEADAYKDVYSRLQLNIAKLKDFNGTKTEEKKIVTKMNNTYGATMGYFKSISEWYQTLVKNSDAYCRQMVKEARARKLADQIAELEIERDNIRYNADGTAKKYSPVREKQDVRKFDDVLETWVKVGEKEVVGSSDLDKAQAAYDQKDKELQFKKKQLESTQKEISKIEMPVMGSSEMPDLNKGEKTRLQEINRLITKYEEQYVKASDSQKESIRVKVDALKKEKAAIEDAKAELDRPLRLDSIEAYDKEISYWQKKRKTATAEQITDIDRTLTSLNEEKNAYEASGRTELSTLDDYSKTVSRLQQMRQTASRERLMQIDETIRKTEEERDAFERSVHVSVSVDKIESIKRLQEEIQHLNRLYDEGTDDERRYASENLPAYEEKLRVMQQTRNALGVATSVSEVSSLNDISEAVALLDQKIQHASEDEILVLSQTRREFEKKREAYERGIKIPEMQKEIDDLLRLPDKVLKVKVESMGFENLSDRIREIDRMLNDLDNPPTEGQRKALTELRDTYAGWQRQTAQSFSTLSSGWNSVKGIGSGIEGITNALTQDTNAWQKITAVVDGFISVYEGIMEVVRIMEMLGMVTKANTAAKIAETAATTASATASEAESVAAVEQAAMQLPVIAANKEAAASFVELAAAEFMAAHASIPFAGFAIGSGFATASAALVKTLGAVSAFATGGIVGGNSTSGDRVLVRVNSGEMILNARQQRNLFNMLNSASLPVRSGEVPRLSPDFLSHMEPVALDITVHNKTKVQGSDLLTAGDNRKRIARKSGRRYL